MNWRDFFGWLFEPEIAPSITFGGVEVPPDIEPYHFLLAGSTGTGKTTLIDEVLSLLIERGDRVIVCDPNGHHLSHFWQEGDCVLNPFDRRTEGWSIFNEVRRDFDYDRLARNVVPDGHDADAQWHHYAQELLSETMRALMLRGEGHTAALMHCATSAPVSELAKLLEGTPAQGLFDADASKAMASTRFVLTSYVAAHKYMKPGTFSLRSWIETGRDNLFLTWREDMQAALMPLVSCWVDVLANAVLSLPSNATRRVWFVLDELGALGRLNSLEGALTRGRKHGLCVIGGLQSTAQLDRTYGKEAAIVLRSCFRNLVVFGIAKSDPDTAEVLSRALGEREIEREQHSSSHGPHGISQGVTLQHHTERIVLPSQISALPDLSAYLALAADRPVMLIQVPVRQRMRVTVPLQE
jgi:type IV secretory pathway TraG/TraD family ATPase VirD4